MARPKANQNDLGDVEYLRYVFNKIEGKRATVSRMLDITPQSISDWIRVQRRIPVEHLALVSVLSGESMQDLRPDLAHVLKAFPDNEPELNKLIEQFFIIQSEEIYS